MPWGEAKHWEFRYQSQVRIFLDHNATPIFCDFGPPQVVPYGHALIRLCEPRGPRWGRRCHLLPHAKIIAIIVNQRTGEPWCGSMHRMA